MAMKARTVQVEICSERSELSTFGKQKLNRADISVIGTPAQERNATLIQGVRLRASVDQLKHKVSPTVHEFSYEQSDIFRHLSLPDK
jgi:hypothetical protein